MTTIPNANIEIHFPKLNENITITALTERQAIEMRRYLDLGEFTVSAYVDERRELWSGESTNG